MLDAHRVGLRYVLFGLWFCLPRSLQVAVGFLNQKSWVWLSPFWEERPVQRLVHSLLETHVRFIVFESPYEVKFLGFILFTLIVCAIQQYNLVQYLTFAALFLLQFP